MEAPTVNHSLNRPVPLTAMIRTGRGAALIIVTAMLLASCAPKAETSQPAAAATVPPASATAASAAADACQLVTPAEAASAIDGAVGPAKRLAPKAGGSSCAYTETPIAIDSGVLTVTIFSAGATFQTVQGMFTNPQPLAGVGDEAFLAHMAGTAGANVGFRVGPTVVLINLGAKGSTEALPAKAQALAAAAARRL
jgi:hypothetical protein